MEEKERFEEIKERLSALLENQISHFRYTLYLIQVSAFPIMLYPASPPLYTFFLLLLLSLPATTQELPIGPNCSQCMIQDSFCGLYPRWLFVSTVFIPEPFLLEYPSALPVLLLCIFVFMCVFCPSSSSGFFHLLLPGKEILTSMMGAFSISLSKNSLKSCNNFYAYHLSLYNMVNKFIA